MSAQYDRTVERKSAPVHGYRSRLLESCVERDAETLEPLDRSALGMGMVTFHSRSDYMAKWGPSAVVWVTVSPAGELEVGSRTTPGSSTSRRFAA